MKTFAICAVTGGLSFVFMGAQLGLFGDRPLVEESQPTLEEKKTAARRNFPEDLAPAARAQPVPDAAEFTADAKTIPMVFLKTNGALAQ